MAEFTTLARPYAKAAFDYAKEANAINEWEKYLSVASTAVKDEAFATLLTNPAVTAKQKTAVLMDVIFSDYTEASSPMSQMLNTMQLPAGVDVSAIVKQASGGNSGNQAVANFMVQLAENDRLALLPEVFEHFAQYKSQELKQVDAYVTTAFPLKEEERKQLQERLAISTSSIVVLHETVDPSLIGGATIKIGDKFTDGSVRGKLKQLKTQLIV